MVYISSDGAIRKEPWGLATIPRLLWGILNFFYLFFITLVRPDAPGSTESSYRSSSGRGGPPPPPRRGIGRLGRTGGPGAPPMGGG